MGTDINMYAERRIGNHWELAGPMEENQWIYCGDSDDKPPYKPAEIYNGRNSALFAILANVKNPAFSLTGYEYIALPRGLPADLSPEVQAWAECWNIGNDGAVFGWGWLSLRELLDFDWSGKTIQKLGVVAKEVRHLFRADRPFPVDRWPSDLPIEYHRGNRTDIPEEDFVYWTETYAESAGRDFMDGVIGKLKEYGVPDDVRIVFWFDW